MVNNDDIKIDPAETKEDIKSRIPRHLRRPWRLLHQANYGDYEQHLRALLDDIGGWPVLMGDEWKGEDFKWHELSMKASDKGFSSDRMISIGISTDDKDSKRRILEVAILPIAPL